jgi:hypothetical protein
MLRTRPGLRELAIFVAAYLTYFGVRAVTQGHPGSAVDNALWLFDVERRIGMAWEQGLQEVVLRRHAVVDLVNAVYIWGHWPVLIVGGVLLFHLRRRQYYALRTVCLISGALGLLVFALFPVAPPRLANLGVDTVTLEAGSYRTVLPPSLVNEYAAMPSFHAGWNLVLGIALFRATRHLAVRVFAVLMPVLMALAVVATANHYVLDVLAGAAIVLAAMWLAEHGGVQRRLRTLVGRAVRRGTPGRERPRRAAGRRAAVGGPHRGGPASVPGPGRGASPQDARPRPCAVGPLGARARLDAAPGARGAARRRGG